MEEVVRAVAETPGCGIHRDGLRNVPVLGREAQRARRQTSLAAVASGGVEHRHGKSHWVQGLGCQDHVVRVLEPTEGTGGSKNEA